VVNVATLTGPELDEIDALLRNAPLPFIAARIRRARRTAGPNATALSHDKFCARTEGLHRANLIGLEKGNHRPRLSTLLRVADAAGRDPRWFVDPEVDPSPFQDEAEREAA
jgi:transcriptional regulator with XRE-family HTH domain